MITDKVLVSEDNVLSILLQMINDLKQKINNKDISLPYTTKLSKSTYLKIDGNGDMFLNNSGKYIQICSITQDSLDINKIYSIFNILHTDDVWNDTGIVDMPTPNYVFGCVEYNGKIYNIGGYNNESYMLSIVQIYDVLSNTWTRGTDMTNGGRYSFGCTRYDNKIYCIGGYNNLWKPTKLVEIYDILSNTWTRGTDIPVPLYGLSAIYHDSKIYCFGGSSDGSSVLDCLYIYDIIGNTWSKGASMKSVRIYSDCAVYNNMIYCIGGWTGSTNLNTMDIYNPANDVWITSITMPFSITSSGCIVFRDKMYIIGGYLNGIRSNAMNVYDILADKWDRTRKSMPTVKSDFGCVIYNGKIYCIGGMNTNNTQIKTIDVLNIGYDSFDIPIPDILYSKLSKIITNGNGNKIFRNDGTYKEIIPVYQTMTTDTINTFLSSI